MNSGWKTFFIVISAGLLGEMVPFCSQAADQSTNSPSAPVVSITSISEQMMELMRKVDAAEAEYLKYHGTNSAPLWQAYASLNAASIPKLIDLASQDPSSASAFMSCVWVVTNRQVMAGAPKLRPYGFKAVELLLNHGYATNSAVAPVCWALGHNWGWHKPSVEFLEEIVAKNADRDAQANARFALARLKKNESEALEWLQIAPAYLEDEWRKAASEQAKTVNPAELRSDAERLFTSVVLSYSNCPVPVKQDVMLGERAAQELYQLQHVWMGQVAPEIEGEDLDGRKLKLSEYRGKIVLLSFWGSWCGPCMAMIPHERKLAERMADLPVALVGVNSDTDRADGKRAVEKEKITWPSFWCGTNGNDGPIPTTWNVKGWPTVYLLDPKGTIRLRVEGFGGTNTDNVLNDAIDRLLKEDGISAERPKN